MTGASSVYCSSATLASVFKMNLNPLMGAKRRSVRKSIGFGLTGFESAAEQYTDDAPVKEQLLHLQVQLDEGEISEEEYIEQESAILQRLRDIENRKREMAGLEAEERQPLSGKVAEGSGASVTMHNTYGK